MKKQPIQVVMLPTKDVTNIMNCVDFIHYQHMQPLCSERCQHVYITVSQDVEQPIKEGDWCYYIKENVIRQVLKRGKRVPIEETIKVVNNLFKNEQIRKIVATNDPKLTSMLDYHKNPTNDITKECYNGVPQVQQSFLKEFVANPTGKWEVEYEKYQDFNIGGIDNLTYKYKLKVNQNNEVNITSVEEKMYSLEKIIESFKAGFDYAMDKTGNKPSLEDWVKKLS